MEIQTKMNKEKYELTSFLTFKEALMRIGYSKNAIRTIYKWYEFKGKKGVASY